MRRAFVSLPDGIWKILDRDFKKQLGVGDSEVIRTLVINYLSEKGYFVNERGESTVEEMNVKIEGVGNMIVALAELLEDKGDITYSEFENKIKKKAEKAARTGR